jgi:aspartyl-tRNA(Asn)/glutamyl-tRNA(Gln) amidotransferase subunit C
MCRRVYEVGPVGVKAPASFDSDRLYYGVMPKATVETVDHVARLARLHLTDAERQLFARQLADILAYAESIQALDTAAVEPMSHALTSGSFREDAVREGLAREVALEEAPDAKDGLFRVPRVLGG